MTLCLVLGMSAILMGLFALYAAERAARLAGTHIWKILK
jgi:hypothetical protein